MRRLWLLFAVVLAVSFTVLGWIGTRIYQEAPPIADKVLASGGKIVVDSGEIAAGQNAWQSLGGMEVGSIWGHGSYVAPDWTADYLHREAVFILDRWAKDAFQTEFEKLDEEKQAQLVGRLTEHLRKNTYNPDTRTLVVDPLRAEAFQSNLKHYSEVFSAGKTDYAIPPGTVTDEARLRQLTAFFFWTAWSATTDRPGEKISYTNNWPYEPLVGNRPSGQTVVWTGVSIIMLLAGISALAWWYAARRSESAEPVPPENDPLGSWKATPSQQATVKYFWVVAALLLAQMLLGVVTAHYGVEGDAFYGIPLSKWLPYSVTRTWHVQLGLFWIATAWLAAGLFIGPLVSGQEPKGQRFGVNLLFLALLIVVVGSLAGEWMSIQNRLTDAQSFYLGHQGYEYVDLGRAWQIALLVGLLLWLCLMLRVLGSALREPGEQKQLVSLLAVATGAIALFYGAGLGMGPAHSVIDRRILALVGGAPVGGRILRGIRHHGNCVCFPAIESNSSRRGGRGGVDVGHHLFGWRHHRYVPSPVFCRNADGGIGLGFRVQRPGSRAAGAGWLRCDGRSAAIAHFPLGATLQMAHLLLHRRGILEHGRRRPVRLHD